MTHDSPDRRLQPPRRTPSGRWHTHPRCGSIYVAHTNSPQQRGKKMVGIVTTDLLRSMEGAPAHGFPNFTGPKLCPRVCSEKVVKNMQRTGCRVTKAAGFCRRPCCRPATLSLQNGSTPPPALATKHGATRAQRIALAMRDVFKTILHSNSNHPKTVPRRRQLHYVPIFANGPLNTRDPRKGCVLDS